MKAKKDPIAELVIEGLGGTSAVARLCGIKPPSVTGWREHGIPSARRQFLELLRPEVFAACSKQMGKSQVTNHQSS